MEKYKFHEAQQQLGDDNPDAAGTQNKNNSGGQEFDQRRITPSSDYTSNFTYGPSDHGDQRIL